MQICATSLLVWSNLIDFRVAFDLIGLFFGWLSDIKGYVRFVVCGDPNRVKNIRVWLLFGLAGD